MTKRTDHRFRFWGNGFRRWRLFDHDMRVGATDPKRRHPRTSRPIHLRPLHAVGGDGESRCARAGIGSQLLEVQMRWNVAMLQAQHGLDEPGDTSGVLQVPHVGLPRTQYQPGRPIAVREDLVQRLEFDRVAQRRTGAVRLDVVDVGRLQPRRCQRGAQHRLLGRPTGDRLPAARTVLVDRRTAHQGPHRIPVAQCITEPLEHYHSAAFTADIAVGGRVKGFALTVGRQHPPPRAGDAVLRAHDQVGSGG